MIRQRQTGDKYGFKMKIAPDLDYLLERGESLIINKYLVRDSDLSGLVIFCTLDDRFINGWRYRNGEVQGKLVPANVEETETSATVSGTRSEEWNIELDEVVIVGYGSKSLMHANLYTQENGYLVFPVDKKERPGNVDTSGPVVDTYGVDNSDNDSDGAVFLSVPQDSIINVHTLSPFQLGILETALEELKNEGCMQEALYRALVSNNVQLNFGMATGISAPANYDPRDKSVKFNGNSNITKDILKEELFHAWQDSHYSGGIWQYRETGKVNIEFEAKLFKDLLNNPEIYNGCCYAFGPDALPEHLYNEYIKWIYDIRDSGNMSFHNNDYQKWLNYFQEYNTEYTSAMHPALTQPSALKGLINISTCIN